MNNKRVLVDNYTELLTNWIFQSSLKTLSSPTGGERPKCAVSFCFPVQGGLKPSDTTRETGAARRQRFVFQGSQSPPWAAFGWPQGPPRPAPGPPARRAPSSGAPPACPGLADSRVGRGPGRAIPGRESSIGGKWKKPHLNQCHLFNQTHLKRTPVESTL